METTRKFSGWTNLISFCRFGMKLVTQFNHEKGHFASGYTTLFLDENRLYRVSYEWMKISWADFNIGKPKIFLTRLIHNLFSAALAGYFFVWMICYAIKYLIWSQSVFVFRNIQNYKNEKSEMLFYGKVHYTSAIISAVPIAIGYLILEPFERIFASFGTFFFRFVVILFKTSLQLLEICTLPADLVIFGIWIVLKLAFKSVKAALAPMFKPMIYKNQV